MLHIFTDKRSFSKLDVDQDIEWNLPELQEFDGESG